MAGVARCGRIEKARRSAGHGHLVFRDGVKTSVILRFAADDVSEYVRQKPTEGVPVGPCTPCAASERLIEPNADRARSARSTFRRLRDLSQNDKMNPIIRLHPISSGRSYDKLLEC